MIDLLELKNNNPIYPYNKWRRTILYKFLCIRSTNYLREHMARNKRGKYK